MQDMYRRTLAASWTSRAHDLPADQLIEEVFAGSSCWNNESHNSYSGAYPDSHNEHLTPEAVSPETRSGKRLSPSFERRLKSSSGNHSLGGGKTPDSHPTVGHPKKGGSIEHQLYDGAKGRGWKPRHAEHELSEFDVREDLRSWEIVTKDNQ